MPSLRSRLIAFYLRHTRKRAFASADELQKWIRNARRVQDHRPPAAIAARFDIKTAMVDGYPVYRLAPKGARAGRRILYIHGGAFCFEMTRFHWDFVADLAARLGAAVTIPIYPLAPEARFETIFGFVAKIYDPMAQEGDLVLMGDSAGATMALVLTMQAALDGRPRPARLVLVSPGLDMTLDNPEVAAMEPSDPWLGIAGGLEALRIYAGHLDRRDWRISPILGDLAVLPPTLVLAGARDMLTPDSIRFAQMAGKAGVEVALDVEPHMIHVWPLFPIPEAKRARLRIADYLEAYWTDRERRLSRPGRPPSSASPS